MTETLTMNQPIPTRTYKDRVFRMLFKEKEQALELYNAMNGTHYGNPDDLIITTLDNAIYMGMKNDISFLLYDQLSLYEHQSTPNPNIPLRDLLYVANIYSNLTKDANLHSSKRTVIPEPRFIVFYNGTEDMPEQYVRKLSDLYSSRTKEPALELKVQVYNINPGYNQELIENCRTLKEYMQFVECTRRYRISLPFEEAIEKSIDACIAAGILADFLCKNKAEVKAVSIFEYDEEKHIQQERDEAMADGIEKGIEKGIQKGTWVKLADLTRKQINRGLGANEIADIFGEDFSEIEQICEILRKNPETDTDQLYELYFSR